MQIPPEILETLANANYNTPRPHPIDPAVFFDLVKIRRLVEDATTLAVRAASGVASSLHNTGNGPLGLGFGLAGGGNPGKLSRERKHRMREQATQKLSRAYRIDEIACSVATMQSASTLEDVASLVLQRSKEDADAKYVHFFHEKIPSRQLAECTSLDPLDDVIASRPTEAEPLRTRATVRIFKEDYEGAAMDLTAALQVHRFNQPSHRASRPQSQSQELQSIGDGQQQRNVRREDIILREEEQPSSFEQQVLFQRGGVYLTIACKHVPAALLDVPQHVEPRTPEDGQGPPTPPPEPSEEALREAHKKVLESRKLVKSYGRKALRDYNAYLSHFEYSPDVPTEVAEDFAKRVNHAVHGLRIPRQHQHTPRPDLQTRTSNGSSQRNTPHSTYALSDLFAASPPADLPPYPRTDLVPATRGPRPTPPQPDATGEALTYHPLLTDALHSLLLCHCLVQTSSKELQRHANMVARLARLADGYPVFQASRSPARADWVEVLRRGDNWINLSSTWETLCAPAPLPVFPNMAANPGSNTSHAAAPTAAARQPKALLPSSATVDDVPDEEERQRAERLHHQAMLSALEDDRVTDMDSLRAAVRAHKRRAEEDERRVSKGLDAPAKQQTGDGEEAVVKAGRPAAQEEAEGLPDSPLEPNPPKEGLPSTDTSPPPAKAAKQTQQHPPPREKDKRQAQPAVPRRWAIDDGKEYPILTERAAAVARWVLEAPPVGAEGAGRKKKKKAGGAAKGGGAAAAAVVGADTEVQGADA